MKKSYKIGVRVKRCDTVFKEGLAPGELVSVVIDFEINEMDNHTKVWMALALNDKEQELIDSVVESTVIEVDPENPDTQIVDENFTVTDLIPDAEVSLMVYATDDD